MNTVPWLRSGVGQTPADGGCIMQIVDWIHRNEWTDSPPCVHPVFRRLAISLNDSLDDTGRQRLLDLAPRMMNTASDDKILSVRLAVFCARSVLHLATNQEAAREATEAAEAWADDPSAANVARCKNAATATAASANAATYAAAATATYAATYATYAATSAANAANAAYARWNLLVDLLDEYDRLTGRTTHPELDYTEVCEVMEGAYARA